jgi:hypothetical protein
VEDDAVAVSEGRSRGPAELAAAAALAAAALGYGWVAAGFPAESAAFPQALAGLLGLLAAAIFLRELGRRRRGAGTGGAFFIHPGRFAIGVGGLVAYVAAVGWIGFLLPSLALGALLPAAVGYRDLRVSAAAAAAAIAFIVAVFVVLLERPLPPDILDGLIGALR